MSLNKTLNWAYWQVWATLAVANDDETGAEVIEWIALVAILVFLMTFVYATIQNGGGQGIADQLITGTLTFVKKIFALLK